MLTQVETIIIILLIITGYGLAIYFYLLGCKIVTDCNHKLEREVKSVKNKESEPVKRIDVIV